MQVTDTKERAQELGETIIDAIGKIDSTNLISCSVEDLQSDIDELEALREMAETVISRLNYLRGVMLIRSAEDFKQHTSRHSEPQ